MFKSRIHTAGTIISVLVGCGLLLMQLSISTNITSAVSTSMSGYSGYWGEDTVKTVEPTIVSAAKGGTGELGTVVEFSEEEAAAERARLAAEAAAAELVLSEDAGVMEKVSFYWASFWNMLFGPKEPKEDEYDMTCKPKKGGGKICTIDRGGKSWFSLW